MSQRTIVNIPHDTVEKKHGRNAHRKESTFIHDCVVELKKTGKTICFEKWQVDEIRNIMFNKKLEIRENDGYYFINIIK